jgi:alpha-glucosidase (family GH31 glycosyl hydrolase)
MAAQSLALAVSLLSIATQGNRVELKLNQGSAELVWITPSTFRFRHSLDGPLTQATWADRESVETKVEETPSTVRLSSRFIEVSFQKRGLLMRVRKTDGDALTSDLSEARMENGAVTWDRAAAPEERFYGLGPRSEPEFDLRGKIARPAAPFLVSTAGYGEYYVPSGSYTFDFTAPARYRIRAPVVDYYFFYGPTPKEIFEEALVTRTAVTATPIGDGRTGSWELLRDSLLRMVHASMSAILMPALDLTPFASSPAPLAERARQLGQISPGVTPEKNALTPFRRQLTTFFATYAEEARDRGFPFFHPLPFQFPEDPEGARHADQFLLGDELLIAPIYTPSASRQVYLPRGIWTNWETNEVHQGRRTITVESQALPIFARNGTIVPLDPVNAGDAMMLHYFPRLGAEFFLLETSVNDWTQVHAAPAADIMRLQIESKVERAYEWVVHHTGKPSAVEFEQLRFTEVRAASALSDRAWYFDSSKGNVHVRVRVRAGEDRIVNLLF